MIAWLAAQRPDESRHGGPEALDDVLAIRETSFADPARGAGEKRALPLQHLAEARPAEAGLRRKVGAAPEGLGRRRQEHGERPAALLAEAAERPHIDLVDVGALLAVDIDVDEALVEDGGGGRVAEALMRHDVAPVAGGVTDGEEDGFRLPAGTLQRLRAPLVPVHRVVGVLQEVRAGGVDQAIWRPFHSCSLRFALQG